MKRSSYILILTIAILTSCKTQKSSFIYKSKTLSIEQLTENTYRHISYLTTEDFGNVACNGMVVINNGEALVFDTPTTNDESNELIDWIKDSLNCKTTGIVVTHFHNDCLGGLNAFHKRKIPSYASLKTIELANADSLEVPKIGFETYLEIKVGNKKVINEFLGEGHAKDNIIAYCPSERVLFGGCLVKTIGANKGYLGDANVQEWPNTVKKVKYKYSKAKVIIPGHGKPGTIELLDYTIGLFKTPEKEK